MEQEMKGRSFVLFLLALVFLLFLLDQTAKQLALARIDPGDVIEVFSFFSLTLVYNPELAFGISFLPEKMIEPFVVVSLFLFILLLYFLPRNAWTLAAGSLILSGGISNLFDRLQEGAVIDYLLLPHWPAFNIADMSISAGFILFIVYLLFFSPRDIFPRRKR